MGELAGGGLCEEAVEAEAERLHAVGAAVHLLDDVAEALGARLDHGLLSPTTAATEDASSA